MGGKPGLKGVPGGRNELKVRLQVDFDIADSILKVLEGQELGNKGLYRKYRPYKEIINISKSYFGPRSPKKRFFGFFRNFLREKSGIRESRVRRRFWESRVRRRRPAHRTQRQDARIPESE